MSPAAMPSILISRHTVGTFGRPAESSVARVDHGSGRSRCRGGGTVTEVTGSPAGTGPHGCERRGLVTADLLDERAHGRVRTATAERRRRGVVLRRGHGHRGH